MIAAMAAAVSAASTSRLLSGRTFLSGKSGFAEASGLLDGLGTGAIGTAGPYSATGFVAGCEVTTATGAPLDGTFWRPTE
jgi:hypothetical protein